MNSAKKKYDQFALLKFVMSLFIFVYHYNALVGDVSEIAEHISNSVVKKLWEVFLTGCRHGEQIPICFFTISGFLAYRCYYDAIIAHKMKLSEFIYRRVLKLYPLLFGSVLYMTLGQWINFYQSGEWWLGRNNDLWHVMQALTGISVGTVMNIFDTVNGPIWYISVLVVCYIVFWLLSVLNIKWNKSKYLIFMLMVLLGIAIQAYSINLPFLNKICSVGYIGFFTGVILEAVLQDVRFVLLAKRMAYVNFIVFIICFILFYDNFLVFASDSNWMCFLVACPMIIFLDKTKMRRLVSNRFFDYLGSISFPLYLLQLPTFCLFTTVILPYFEICHHLLPIIFTITITESIVWISLEKYIREWIEAKVGDIRSYIEEKQI